MKGRKYSKLVRSNFCLFRWLKLLLATLLFALTLNYFNYNLLEKVFVGSSQFFYWRKTDMKPTEVVSRFVCQIVEKEGINLAHKNFTVLRIVGPTNYPLADPTVLSRTLKHILHSENELRRSSSCIQSIWIINCMYNYTSELGNIERTLKAYKQTFFTFKNCSRTPKFVFDGVLNLNEARTFAVKVARNYESDWTLFLQGNSFLPRQALHKTVSALISASKAGVTLKALPYFGTANCDENLFSDLFELNKKSIQSLLFKGFHVLEDDYTRSQPGYFAVSGVNSEPNIATNLFSMSFQNGSQSDSEKNSKLELLSSVATSEASCGGVSGARSVDDLLRRVNQIAAKCGYLLKIRQSGGKNTCQTSNF